MEAMIAATLTAVGSLAMAVVQARTARKESELLHGDWEVEPVVWLPNLRLDSAHQNAAPVSALSGKKLKRKKKVHLTFPAATGNHDSLDRDNLELSDSADEDWESEFAEQRRATKKTKPSTEKVPLETLKFAPFLLESTTIKAWGVLLGVFLLAGLFGPQINPGFTQINALLIPLVTLALTATFPLPWAWAAVAVGCLQGANCLGYWLAGETYQAGDGNFCVAMYLFNALVVAAISAFVMQRHRQMIVMKPE